VPFLQKKVRDRIGFINALIRKYGPMTVRQVYYQLAPYGLNYRQAEYACQKGRELGLIPVEMIVDRTRPSYGLNKWTSLNGALESMEQGFKLDYWKDSLRFEIWTEKDALSQILYEEADRYRVPVRVTRGFLSTSARHKWSDPELVILYFGDFDPSGLYMDEDLKGSEFMNYVYFKRIALTKEQIKDQNLPSVKVKMSDSRAKRYVEEHGYRGWELDALPPDYLRQLVRTTIEPVIDFDLDAKRKEELEIRRQISEFRRYVA